MLDYTERRNQLTQPEKCEKQMRLSVYHWGRIIQVDFGLPSEGEEVLAIGVYWYTEESTTMALEYWLPGTTLDNNT